MIGSFSVDFHGGDTDADVVGSGKFDQDRLVGLPDHYAGVSVSGDLQMLIG